MKPQTFQEDDVANDNWVDGEEGLGMEGEQEADFAPPEVEYDMEAEVK